MHPGIEPISAVVLNRSVGGLDPYVAEAAVHYGARVVWMPSNHAKHHADFFDIPDYPQFGRIQKQLPGQGIGVLDDQGNLKPEALQIVDVVASNDVALATGHLSLPEIRALLDAAIERGVTRFVVTHANWSLCKLDIADQKELVAKGATLEYVACTIASPIFHEQFPDELAGWIEEVGADHLVLGSDLGQFVGPPHPEGLRMVLAALLGEGVPYDDLEKMTKANPAKLLGLPD
jgi:hypothetical protein